MCAEPIHCPPGESHPPVIAPRPRDVLLAQGRLDRRHRWVGNALHRSLLGMAVRVWLVALILGAFAGSVWSQPASHCDSAVPTNNTIPIGYQERGDRCEGKYRNRNVAAADIALMAFDASRQSLQPGSVAVLQWQTPPQDAWLTAQSLRRDLLYRMDRRVRRSEQQFRWDTSLVQAAGFGANELGLVLTSLRVIAGRQELVHYPVGSALVSRTAMTPRRLLLRLGADFRSLKWRLSRYAANDQIIDTTSDWNPMRVSLWKGLIVPIDVTLSGGSCYLMEVAGRTTEELPASKEFYLCEPAK